MHDDYIKKMEARLKALDEEIGKLKAKAESSGAELREKSLEHVARLRRAGDGLRSDLGKLRETGSERFETVRKELDRAYDDLRKGIHEIVEKLRKAA